MGKHATTKTERKTGAPTKFSKSLQDRMRLLYQRGFTDVEICQTFLIAESTLNRWKERYPAFWESLNDWKAQADEKVKRSLYERAVGYTHPEEKIFCNEGQIIRADTTRHYPPETTAGIFWLKNRQPKEWRDKQEVEHTFKPMEINIVIEQVGG